MQLITKAVSEALINANKEDYKMNIIPPAVRILPMNRIEEFPDCDSVVELQQKFFLDDLPTRPNGDYLFLKRGLISKQGTVVLFQCEGTIIASAILKGYKRFEHADEDGYEGCLYFDVASIKVFDPIGQKVIDRIWPEVKRLGRVKWSLDPKGLATFERELKHVKKTKT
jgi:hypothetical protein